MYHICAAQKLSCACVTLTHKHACFVLHNQAQRGCAALHMQLGTMLAFARSSCIGRCGTWRSLSPALADCSPWEARRSPMPPMPAMVLAATMRCRCTPSEMPGNAVNRTEREQSGFFIGHSRGIGLTHLPPRVAKGRNSTPREPSETTLFLTYKSQNPTSGRYQRKKQKGHPRLSRISHAQWFAMSVSHGISGRCVARRSQSSSGPQNPIAASRSAAIIRLMAALQFALAFRFEMM